MSTTTFFIALAAGGLVIGALCSLVLPRKRTGGLLAAAWAGAFGTCVAGLFITEVFGAEHDIGLAAFAIGPVYVFSGLADRFSSGGHSSGGDWGGGDSCGDSGGGGDGGGGCD